MEVMEIAILVVIIGSAVILHECAHGWAAYLLGDPTAKLAGRLTLNPLKHIDPVGTIILPGILILMRTLGMHTIVFGWAKPVPVNFLRLNNPKRDMMLVGVAGPLSNILLAFALSRLLAIGPLAEFSEVIKLGILVNLLLAVFNMVPVPPLDGSRLLAGLLPDRLAADLMRVEPFGILIVFGLLYFGLFQEVVWPVVIFIAKSMGV